MKATLAKKWFVSMVNSTTVELTMLYDLYHQVGSITLPNQISPFNFKEEANEEEFILDTTLKRNFLGVNYHAIIQGKYCLTDPCPNFKETGVFMAQVGSPYKKQIDLKEGGLMTFCIFDKGEKGLLQQKKVNWLGAEFPMTEILNVQVVSNSGTDTVVFIPLKNGEERLVTIPTKYLILHKD